MDDVMVKKTNYNELITAIDLLTKEGVIFDHDAQTVENNIDSLLTMNGWTASEFLKIVEAEDADIIRTDALRNGGQTI